MRRLAIAVGVVLACASVASASIVQFDVLPEIGLTGYSGTVLGAPALNNQWVVVGIGAEGNDAPTAVTFGGQALAPIAGGLFDSGAGGNRGVSQLWGAQLTLGAGDQVLAATVPAGGNTAKFSAVSWILGTDVLSIRDSGFRTYRDDENTPASGGNAGDVGFNLPGGDLNMVLPLESTDTNLSTQAGDLVLALLDSGADAEDGNAFQFWIDSWTGLTPDLENEAGDFNSYTLNAANGTATGVDDAIGGPVQSGYFRMGLAAVSFEVIPEPASVALFGLGALVLGLIRRKR